MDSNRWLHFTVRVAVAAVCAFVGTSTLLNWAAKPKVIVVATYGQPMPWEALLTPRKSLYASNLQEMVSKNWVKKTEIELAEDLPKKYFDLHHIESASWDEWDVVTDVKGFLAESQKGAFPKLFSGFSNLVDEVRARNRTETIKRSSLVVAITPERNQEDLTNRLRFLQLAVEKSLPGIPVEFKVCPTYEEVLLGLGDGSIDFALCSPYSTVIVHQALSNDLLLLGQTAKTSVGAYQAGYKVDLIKSKDELEVPENVEFGSKTGTNITFIYGSQFSTSGYLIPLRILDGLGVDLSRLHFDTNSLTNHDAVINKVQSSKYYLAGVPSDKLEPRFTFVRSSVLRGSEIGIAVGILICLLCRVVVRTFWPKN